MPVCTAYRRAEHQPEPALTYVWSQYGGPTISVPCGFHPVSGMPVGLQLSAAPWREDLLFRVAARYEDATRWHEVRLNLAGCENPVSGL
jgi:Asp-tRNA(Asn)/Glu-tRNA(Gln) amidotransferase A subunit family amidase